MKPASMALLCSLPMLCADLKVKDAAASIDPWIQIPDLSENLGHIALAEGRMKDALQLYNHVQRRWHRGTSAELLQLSARALYDEDSRRYTGGETYKVSLLPEARVQLMKAVHLDPSNPQMRFNAATVMQVPPVAFVWTSLSIGPKDIDVLFFPRVTSFANLTAVFHAQ